MAALSALPAHFVSCVFGDERYRRRPEDYTDGPWQEDVAQHPERSYAWQHASYPEDVWIEVVRTPWLTWSGYVHCSRVHEVDYEKLDVHGGVVPCETSYGFDTMHFGDGFPVVKSDDPEEVGGVYRTFEYVKREAVKLADQIVSALASSESKQQ